MKIQIFHIKPTSTVRAKTYHEIIYKDDRPVEIPCKPASAPWGDCVPPLSSHLPLVVSQRIRDSITANKLTGIRLDKVKAYCGRPTKEALDYYIVEPTLPPPPLTYRLWALIDGSYKFITESPDRNFIDSHRRNHKIKISESRIQRTWDEKGILADFMRAPDTDSGTYVFGGFLCSRRVVEIAYTEAWTNVAFVPIDSFGDMLGNLLDNPWPPELWYPAYQPKP